MVAEPPPPEPVKEEPKPKASAKPKAKSEPKAEPKPVEPKEKAKAAPKAETKAAAKAGAKKKEVKPEPPKEEEKKKEKEPTAYIQMDDGTGGDWEMSTGQSKKQDKRKAKQQEKEAERQQGEKDKKISESTARHNQNIPGAAPAGPSAAQLNAAKVNQSVGATGAKAAEKTTAADAKDGKEEKKPAEKTDTVSVKVGEQNIGKVIGPKGQNLIKIKEKTGVTSINTEADFFMITGRPDDVKAAEAAIIELRDKGYMSLAYENFKEDFVMAHPSTFPDIIGSKGAIIRKLKEELSVEVSIPQGVSSTSKNKHKVSIAGASEATAKAKKVIEDIIMYYHHEITHPGLTHAELDVPWECYSFIIGKAGSELRHIQKNWNVKVSIPREFSENQNVVIVGEPRDVESAKKYVEKLVSNAQNYSTGRDKAEKADDGWGEEGEDEPWMKQYMYQRR